MYNRINSVETPVFIGEVERMSVQMDRRSREVKKEHTKTRKKKVEVFYDWKPAVKIVVEKIIGGGTCADKKQVYICTRF